MDIFLTGCSGYIGGSVASALIKKGHYVRALVRSNKSANLLKASGVEPIIGSLEDTSLIKSLALSCDSVINCADAEHSACVKSILSVLKDANKCFIHTSGSSIVGDVANGEIGHQVFDEESKIKPNPGRQNRFNINNLVIKSASNSLRTIVIAPTLIYGNGLGIKADSIQLPWLISLAKKRNCAHHIGAGENIWSNVHIEDVVDLYLLALERGNGFYFAENGENSMRELCIFINDKLNISQSPKRISMIDAIAEWGEVPANYTMGSNSRVLSKRAKNQLGWSPFRPSIQEFISSQYFI